MEKAVCAVKFCFKVISFVIFLESGLRSFACMEMSLVCYPFRITRKSKQVLTRKENFYGFDTLT